MCIKTNDMNELREDIKQQDHHEKQMKSDMDYFCEWVLENHYFDKPKFLFDVVDELRKVCDKYEHDFKELCDFIKGS